MSKAASSTTTAKATASSKKPATSKTRAAGVPPGASAAPATATDQTALPVESQPSDSGSEVHALTSILQRLDRLEENIVGGFATLTEAMRALQTTPSPAATEPSANPEAMMPLFADALRHNLMEHLSPVSAALKRLEERIGFVANRLKFSGGSGGGGGQDRQDRQKPWRGEQGRHARPQRGPQQNGQPRQPPPQPQQWTPPSAASVQGHFAPRPSPARGFMEEDE